MEIKFCERAGCYEPAVGTGIRPVKWCRPHYVEAVSAELVRAEVIGDVPVVDVRTGQSVGKGGTVELDPVETKVAQLAYARHIKVLKAEAKPAKAKG